MYAERQSALFGDLVVGVFRLNGELLAKGDRLTADLGITSARWQVLGALEMAEKPLPVAQIARNMGLARQSVQRIANELESAGLIRFEENPNHRTARLVALAPAGRRVFQSAMRRQAAWAKEVVRRSGLREHDLRETIALLQRLRESL
jgi:DNA-binding MarR family transcriptional regulator